MNRSRRLGVGRLVRPDKVPYVVITLAVAAATLAPLFEVVLRSVQKQTGLLTHVYSLDNYHRLAAASMLSSAANSFIIAGGASVLATLVGVVLAWLVARTDMPGRQAIEIVSYIPFFLTPLISAVAWSYLLDPRTGLLNHWLRFAHISININSTAGIIWVLAIAWVPLVMLMCMGIFRQMDPALEHAARLAGTNVLGVARRITLPLATPGIVSAFVLVFVLSFDELGAPLVLGYPYGIQTLSTRLYDTITRGFPPDYDFAAAIGCVMIIVAIVAFWLQRRAVGQRSYATVTGRSMAQEPLRLGRGRWLAFALSVVYLAVGVVLPFLALILASMSRHWSGLVKPSLFTLGNYVQLFFHDPTAITAVRNSSVLAVLAALVAIVASLFTTYSIERVGFRGSRIVDAILAIPIAVPGLAFAVGVLDGLIRSPLYGTLWIIGVAYVLRFYPYGSRSIHASLSAIHPELEESAKVCGSGRLRTLRVILLPLLRQGIVSGWLLLFIMFLREVSISNILWNRGTQTLSVALLNNVYFQPAGVAAAFTVVQVLIILVPALLILRFVGTDASQYV